MGGEVTFTDDTVTTVRDYYRMTSLILTLNSPSSWAGCVRHHWAFRAQLTRKPGNPSLSLHGIEGAFCEDN